jgi:putative sterol carrier protein
MATVEECRAALDRLAERMAAHAAETNTKLDLDRSLTCRIPDLDTAFHGRLVDGRIIDLTDGDDPTAKLKLTAKSDDLVAMVDGELNLASAWANGRIKIDASFLDLLKLRKLM